MRLIISLAVMILAVAGCGDDGESRSGVAVVLAGHPDDRGFNQFSLAGARAAATDLGLPFASAAVNDDLDGAVERFVAEGYPLIITVGFMFREVTAAAARAHPEVHFVIVDVDYESYDDLRNVTSLTFAEDEAGYLAGVLAGCVTSTNTIGSVAGIELPTVVRFVTGYQHGARHSNPQVVTLNEYLPSFDDPVAGGQRADEMIAQGADVVFAVGGTTGNGALAAAHTAGVKGIGVDVDQFFTLPEVASVLITSAVKNVDVATDRAVREFAAGELHAGIQRASVANGGVGLAPYHDFENRISASCKAMVEAARDGLAEGTIDTGS